MLYYELCLNQLFENQNFLFIGLGGCFVTLEEVFDSRNKEFLTKIFLNLKDFHAPKGVYRSTTKLALGIRLDFHILIYQSLLSTSHLHNCNLFLAVR